MLLKLKSKLWQILIKNFRYDQMDEKLTKRSLQIQEERCTSEFILEASLFGGLNLLMNGPNHNNKLPKKIPVMLHKVI